MSGEVKDKGLRVRSSTPFKLKDKPDRQFMPIHLMKKFGFVPEIVIIEKVRGSNNGLVVRAVLTPEEIKKEDVELAKQKKEKK